MRETERLSSRVGKQSREKLSLTAQRPRPFWVFGKSSRRMSKGECPEKNFRVGKNRVGKKTVGKWEAHHHVELNARNPCSHIGIDCRPDRRVFGRGFWFLRSNRSRGNKPRNNKQGWDIRRTSWDERPGGSSNGASRGEAGQSAGRE